MGIKDKTMRNNDRIAVLETEEVAGIPEFNKCTRRNIFQIISVVYTAKTIPLTIQLEANSMDTTYRKQKEAVSCFAKFIAENVVMQ